MYQIKQNINKLIAILSNCPGQYLAFLWFLFLALTILWPLLKPGFILTLDMFFPFYGSFSDRIFGLEQFSPPYIDTQIPIIAIVELLKLIMPLWLIQKIILLTILLLAGITAYNAFPFSSKLSKTYAGTLYLFNPFVQSRLLSGQWKILGAYALIPLAFSTFTRFLDQPNKKSLLLSIITLLAVTMFSIHGFVLCLMPIGIHIAFYLFRIKSQLKENKKTLLYLFMWGILLLLINTYWWLPISSYKTTMLSQIDYADIQIFGAKSFSDWGINLEVASLYGFWRKTYIFVRDIIPFWFVFIIPILYLSINGIIQRKKTSQIPIGALGLTAIISFLLSIGPHGITKPLFEFLFENINAFSGFRDSHKFTMLIALSYSILGAAGLQNISERISQKKTLVIFTASIIIVLLNSFTLFNGIWNQLDSVNFPVEWRNAKKHILEQTPQQAVFIYPWHGYMKYKWNATQKVYSPALFFFRPKAYVAQNVETANIYTYSTGKDQLLGHQLYKAKTTIKNTGSWLSLLNIGTILLLKEDDYEKYTFILEQNDIRLIEENKRLFLLKNLVKSDLIFQPDHSLEDKHINGKIQFEEKIPIDNKYYPSYKIVKNFSGYSIKISDVNYSKPLVLALPFSELWQINNQKSLPYFGIANVYNNLNEKEITIKYTPSQKYLLGYLISICTLLIMILIAFDLRKIQRIIKKR